MKKINLSFKNYSYPAIIDSIDYLKHVELKDYDKIFILCDRAIHNLYSKEKIFNSNFNVIIMDGNERNKSLVSFEKIINEMAENYGTRNSLMIAVGGGVISDMGSFVASVYKRGIDHILIPTTLLGMVDAAIGGKTGLNNKYGKNLIGTFKQPKSVIINPHFLKTLDKRQLINGLAEIIKYALISDKKLFKWLLENSNKLVELSDFSIVENIIFDCIEYKKSFIAEDEFDKNKRMLLNFGHTFGHALETELEYKDILHGEAILYGMIAAAYLSFKLGKIQKDELDTIKSFILKVNQFKITDLDFDKVISSMKNDKKNYGNSVRFIILENIGNAEIAENVPAKFIEESLMHAIKAI